MDEAALRKWLANPDPAIVSAVADDIRAQVDSLKSAGTDFYGYALLPGEPYDISTITAVTNSEADIKVAPTDKHYRYYRFGVNEWKHFHRGGFAAANALLGKANKRFASMHTKAASDYRMDEFEIAHSRSLLKAVMLGLELAKKNGVFGDKEPFLAVWIMDSGHPIMAESVRRLNSKTVVQQFMAEFGSTLG
jgi:hypothetical protein